MFYDKFHELCVERGISVTKATEEIGLARTIGTKWKQTGATPNGATLQKIADYFGVTVSELLGETKQSVSGEQEFYDYLTELRDDRDMRVLFSLVNGATTEEIKATVAFLKTLRGHGGEE